MVGKKTATAAAIALAVLVGGASLLLRMRQAVTDPGQVRFDAVPQAVGLYLGTEERFADETYAVLQADTSMLRRFEGPDGIPTWFFAAYFGDQNYGEQIHSPRHCLPGGGWQILSLEKVPVELPGRGRVTSNRLLIEAHGQRQVMYYFFITRMGPEASEYRLKFELARAALSFRPRDALFVRVSTPVADEEVSRASRRAEDVLVSCMPFLDRGLPF